MKYREKNGKWIFEKDGVFFSMTKDQLREMRDLCIEIVGDQLEDYAGLESGHHIIEPTSYGPQGEQA